MLELLTGAGLATSAGLNAYIPLLLLGLMARFTDLATLPSGWQWLEHEWTLGILAVLLAIEVVADKIPVVDHLNDVIQTFVRPTSGGLAFGAASSAQTLTVSNPSDVSINQQWLPIVAGMVIAFVVHVMKAMVRPVVNMMTAGFGAPVASIVEDSISVLLTLAAVVFPFLIILFLLALVWLFVALLRRRRRKKRELAARREAGRQPPLYPPPYPYPAPTQYGPPQHGHPQYGPPQHDPTRYDPAVHAPYGPPQDGRTLDLRQR